MNIGDVLRAILSWLNTEPGVGWIVGVGGTVLSLVIWWNSNKRPSIILIKRVSQQSLISVNPKIRGKLSITYEDQPIDDLYETVFEVSNTGQKPVMDVAIRFLFEGLGSADFLEVVLTSREGTHDWAISSPDSKHDSLTLEIPFLNPRKQHGHYLSVITYAPKPVTVTKVTGTGPGWSTRYADKAESRHT